MCEYMIKENHHVYKNGRRVERGFDINQVPEKRSLPTPGEGWLEFKWKMSPVKFLAYPFLTPRSSSLYSFSHWSIYRLELRDWTGVGWVGGHWLRVGLFLHPPIHPPAKTHINCKDILTRKSICGKGLAFSDLSDFKIFNYE